MSGTGSSFFDLQARLKKRKKCPAKRSSAHYDSGLAIDVRYNPAFYAPSGSSFPSTLSRPFSAALHGAPFRVEAFEQEEEEDYVYGTEELEDLDDDELQRSSLSRASSSSPDSDMDVPVWGTAELEPAVQDTGAASSMSDLDVEQAPVWGTEELGELEAVEPIAGAQSYASPNAAAFARKIEEERLLASEDPDTRAFAKDLESILAGKKDHPSTTPRHTIEEEEEPDETPQNSQNKAYPSGLSHDVFDQMGRNMSMAKTFDLGSYDVSNQFDAFDRQIDNEEQRAERRKHQAMQKHEQARNEAHEFAEDLSYITSSVPPPRSRALDTAATYDLTFDVPLIPQQTGMSCWAAGAAMLVAWRDQMSIDPSEIANATGAWAAYRHGLLPNDTSIFPVWGMVPEAPQSYSVEGFYGLLNMHGPLWVAGAVPGPHIRVVTGMRGDGTPDGTTLLINDPWETGMATFHMPNAGAQYTRSYSQFVREMETLARSEMDISGAIYVAHLQGPRRR